MRANGPAPRWSGVVAAVARRPDLWPTAVGQVLRVAPAGWWRRPPFLPVPDAEYVRFRIATQQGHGDAGAVPAPDDVVEYLRWCRTLAPGSR